MIKPYQIGKILIPKNPNLYRLVEIIDCLAFVNNDTHADFTYTVKFIETNQAYHLSHGFITEHYIYKSAIMYHEIWNYLNV